MHILGPHPRPTQSDNLKRGAQQAFTKPPGDSGVHSRLGTPVLREPRSCATELRQVFLWTAADGDDFWSIRTWSWLLWETSRGNWPFSSQWPLPPSPAPSLPGVLDQPPQISLLYRDEPRSFPHQGLHAEGLEPCSRPPWVADSYTPCRPQLKQHRTERMSVHLFNNSQCLLNAPAGRCTFPSRHIITICSYRCILWWSV